MNKDNAAQYLPLVQALADGKVVHRTHSISKPRWLNLEEMVFDLPPEHYRIKPEPREWWIVEHVPAGCRTPVRYVISDERSAMQYASDLGVTAVHVREVTQ